MCRRGGILDQGGGGSGSPLCGAAACHRFTSFFFLPRPLCLVPYASFPLPSLPCACHRVPP